MKLNPKITKVFVGLGLSAVSVMAGSGALYFEGKENN